MSNQEVLDRVSDVIRAYPSIQVAWVFGSVANDTATPESDLDCAVLGPAPLAASTMQALINDLAEETGRPVDLIDLQATHGPVVGRVLKHGTQLFCDDNALYGALIARWVTDQADWMPLRRRIVQTRLKQWIAS